MRIGVLTSGGDAPGMNAALRAVVRSALVRGWRVYGIGGGYCGLFREQIEVMDSRAVANILSRGGSVLGCGRSRQFATPQGRRQAAGLLTRKGIDALVAIGGDGTYRGLLALTKEHGVPVVGIPGSIDNDVGGTDVSIGFDTAVNTALEAIDRIRDTAFTHERLFFIEVMGRRAGHIANAVALAGGAEAVGVPEAPTDVDALAAQIDASARRGKLASIIVVAEGHEAGGAEALHRAVTARLRRPLDSRLVVLGHLQRGGGPSATDRIAAARLGAHAIDTLSTNKTGAQAVGLAANRLTATPLQTAVAQHPPFDYTWLHLGARLGSPQPTVEGHGP